MTEPRWLGWVQPIQALAQDGLACSTNPFDIDRYRASRRLVARMMAEYGQCEFEILDRLFATVAVYATPKLDAHGAVFHYGKLLMVLEKPDGGWACWARREKNIIVYSYGLCKNIRPRKSSLAITFAIYGYHFRQVFQNQAVHKKV